MIKIIKANPEDVKGSLTDRVKAATDNILKGLPYVLVVRKEEIDMAVALIQDVIDKSFITRSDIW